MYVCMIHGKFHQQKRKKTHYLLPLDLHYVQGVIS